MSHQLARRRRQIRGKGRPMELQRLVRGSAAIERSVTLLGFDSAFAPDQLSGGVQQGDLRVHTLNDEIAAAAWPDGPKTGDKLAMDGATYTLRGADAVHAGPLLIGWVLWIRGGA